MKLSIKLKDCVNLFRQNFTAFSSNFEPLFALPVKKAALQVREYLNISIKLIKMEVMHHKTKFI